MTMTTTYYVKNRFEVTEAVTTTYFYLGGQRVAMRQATAGQADQVTYLHSDHLGRMSAWSGSSSGSQAYYPFGLVRTTTGTAPTDVTFTGQRVDRSTAQNAAGTDGLLYYGARYYDAYLNRWVQPDSMVPNPLNPQNLDRYSYTVNNPVRYTDPTGHCAGDADDPDNQCWRELKRIEHDFPNLQFHDTDRWQLGELQAFLDALTRHVFRSDIESAEHIDLYRRGIYAAGTPNATENVYGEGMYSDIGHAGWLAIYDSAYKADPLRNSMAVAPALINFEAVLIHELAHVAIDKNSEILSSYRWPPHPPSLVQPFGQNLPSSCGADWFCSREWIASTAVLYTLQPAALKWQWGPLSEVDWRYDWLDNWVKSHE